MGVLVFGGNLDREQSSDPFLVFLAACVNQIVAKKIFRSFFEFLACCVLFLDSEFWIAIARFCEIVSTPSPPRNLTAGVRGLTGRVLETGR